MSAVWMLIAATVWTVVTTMVGEMASEEVRGRLENLPTAILCLAARRVSDEYLRQDLLEEWEGELHEILRGSGALPVSRLWKGLLYAAGIARSSREISASLGDPRQSAAARQRPRVRSAIKGTGHFLVTLIATCFVGLLLYGGYCAIVALVTEGDYRGSGPSVWLASSGVFITSITSSVFAGSDAKSRVLRWISATAVVVTLGFGCYQDLGSWSWVDNFAIGIGIVGMAATVRTAKIVRVMRLRRRQHRLQPAFSTSTSVGH
jgi:hypothetical protein